MIFLQQNNISVQVILCKPHCGTPKKWIQQFDTPVSVTKELQLCRENPNAFNELVWEMFEKLSSLSWDWKQEKSNWKSRICIHGKKCRFLRGGECDFAHSRVIQLAIGLLRNPLYKSETCRYSECSCGKDCIYAHRGDLIQQLDSENLPRWAYFPPVQELGPIGGARCTSFLGRGWDRYEGPSAPFESYFSCQKN